VYQPPPVLPCSLGFAIWRNMTELLAADAPGISRAAALLRAGELVALGTETVYGLGADATNARAVAAVFAAKQRPRFNPLICHYPDREAAFVDVVPNEIARRMAASLWPGPLTLVLPRRPQSRVALLTAAGLDSLAVRVPSHPAAAALLRAVARPVAAPSANRSGTVSPTTAQHVLDGLAGRIAAVLDSGPCPVGIESTVLDLMGHDPVLLRPGGTTLEAIEAEIGPVVQSASSSGVLRSPGMMASHYAPSLPVRLDAVSVSKDEALLAFGTPLPGAGTTYNLSPGGDPIEAAARLFVGLRTLDATGPAHGCKRIAVMPIPSVGLGHAINDRLRRAASPR
jgi:L-threonylcarbamoyladenylate synthase